MSIVLRPGNAADAAPCGTICYEAFKTISMVHNFPPCLEAGLKLVFQMTLMTIGLYSEPTGPYMPSVLY
jgi:hypothetical protein